MSIEGEVKVNSSHRSVMLHSESIFLGFFLMFLAHFHWAMQSPNPENPKPKRSMKYHFFRFSDFLIIFFRIFRESD
uniref:Transmembrane protein n=1 Tax=Candidatus Kentrum sp. LPFa TaxID=2126335 RepID=A0A450W5L0_9GAMM|nr:MAG: hypothetical protein BECKLPF1236A_GA0070988_100687 [Candidatus Kentron sp. LPFa]VFK24306.1 MAG: hypothetical protein BECKLPF1236C_GA0070990_1001218 [Candidatus Kentron sp. LPFa]